MYLDAAEDEEPSLVLGLGEPWRERPPLVSSLGRAVHPPHVDVDGVLRVRRDLDPLGRTFASAASASASLSLDLDVPARDALQGEGDSQDGVPLDGLKNAEFHNIFVNDVARKRRKGEDRYDTYFLPPNQGSYDFMPGHACNILATWEQLCSPVQTRTGCNYLAHTTARRGKENLNLRIRQFAKSTSLIYSAIFVSPTRYICT